LNRPQQHETLPEGTGSSWAEQIDAADQEAKKDKYTSLFIYVHQITFCSLLFKTMAVIYTGVDESRTVETLQ
jgi:hypothetical protein